LLMFGQDTQAAGFKIEKKALNAFADMSESADKVIDDKVINKIKEEIKIDTRKVTTDEFNKLFTK